MLTRAIIASASILAIYAGSVVSLPARADERTAVRQPVVAFIHIQTCPVCARVRAVMPQLEKEFNNVKFVNLDVSDKQSTDDSHKIAKEFGISQFLSGHEESFPTVGVFNKNHKLVSELKGAKAKTEYEQAIRKALMQK